jgi:predicted N-formylglutamate amidohydrolase
MKRNKHNERVASLKDEIKALSDNLDWALRQNDNLSQKNNKLESKNNCLAKLARHNGLVLVLMGIMLDSIRNEHDDSTITNMKNAILKYYEETAKIITMPETQIDDDEETYE